MNKKASYLSRKQENWFEKVREGLEQETGKSIDYWVRIAKKCPEQTHQRRLKWFKSEYGIGLNRASCILAKAFDSGIGWDNPDALLETLWKVPELRAVYDSVETYTKSLSDDVVVGPRKTFSGFSRNYQFAAMRPVKGQVRLGLALDPEEYNLDKRKSSDSWSDRLKSVVVLSSTKNVDKDLKALIKSAWMNS